MGASRSRPTSSTPSMSRGAKRSTHPFRCRYRSLSIHASVSCRSKAERPIRRRSPTPRATSRRCARAGSWPPLGSNSWLQGQLTRSSATTRAGKSCGANASRSGKTVVGTAASFYSQAFSRRDLRDRSGGPLMEQSSSLRLSGRVFLVALLVLLAIWILRPLLPAIAWAGVLALATWPARGWLIRKGMSSSSAAISLTLFAGILLVGPLIILAIAMAKEALVVVRTLQELREVGLGTPVWVPQLPFVGEYMASWWQDHLADPDAVKELLGRAESMDVIRWTRSLGSEAVSRLVILAFTLLTLFFAYRDGPTIAKQSRIIADRVFGPSGERLGEEAIVAIRATVNGLVLVGLAEGAVLGFAYALASVSHAVLFAFATALLATVPFGATMMFVIACLTLVIQSRIVAAVLLFVFASIVIFVADHFIRPALIGASTRLPFLGVLLGIFGGVEPFGLIGLCVGPAIMAAVIAIWREGAKPATPDA